MLKLAKIDEPSPVGLAFRIVATAPYGAKPSHKLLPSEVLNKHWSVANREGRVAFSTNVEIDFRAKSSIERIYFFANSKGQTFLCQAEVEQIISSEEPFIPTALSAEIQVPEWIGEKKKNWIILRNFKQLDIDSCELELLNKTCLLRDQIFVPRFRTCFVK